MSSSPKGARRVVVTGLGVITPLGSTLEAYWEGLVTGRSGVTSLEVFPNEFLPTACAGQIHDFTGGIDDFGALDGERKKAIRKGIKLMCRECQMGVAAAQRALDHAGLTAGGFDPERAGVVYGSDYMLSDPREFNAGMDACTDGERQFHFDRWGQTGMPQLSPLWLLKYLPNMPACHIAIYNDLRGPNNSLTQREASANLAVGEAFRTIQRGSADIMVAGATGTRLHLMKTLHVAQQEELAPHGVPAAEASRPFDRQRAGMVLGEGSAALILEHLESAVARGARIYGEIGGSGSSFVADRRLVAKRGQALANAIRSTLREADVSPASVGHIHAHGLSTRSCDVEEANAIREVFNGASDEIPVVAAKSHFGNLGAGSGAAELVASVLALSAGELFPVLNYQHPDPECRLRIVNSASVSAGRSALNLSVTPQGQASAVLVRAMG
jgi:3-oxoacyl-[acyl-carrier-protein] synthase II